jgi:hypothetical protein
MNIPDNLREQRGTVEINSHPSRVKPVELPYSYFIKAGPNIILYFIK